MFCFFCKKSASQLATHHLCDCCLLHQECCEPNTEKSIPVIPEEDAFRKVKCDICLERYQKGKQEEHREMCIARLMFRCSVCDGDYVNKEGLWNHLDLHEISDESKELHYQELRATYKLHKCILCNDQRGFKESLYWRHVHEDHDGFFLRCSECSESFRSQKQKKNHALNECKARKQMEASTSSELETDQEINTLVLPMHVETTAFVSCGKSSPYGSPAVQLEILQGEQKKILEEDCKSIEVNLVDPRGEPVQQDVQEFTKCNFCDRIFTNLYSYNYHQLTFHSEPQEKCPHCSQMFHLKETLQHHLSKHAKDQDAAELEPLSVDFSGQNSISIAHRHEKIDNTNASNSFIEVLVCQPKERSLDVTNDADVTHDTSCSNDKEIAQPVDENSSSGSSDTKCPHCNKECYHKTLVSRHIIDRHQPTDCDICGLTLIGIVRFRYHKLKSHTEPMFKCSSCPVALHQKSAYHQHLAKHQNERKFPCEICGKKFKDPIHVTMHMRRTHHVRKGQKNQPLSDMNELLQAEKVAFKEDNKLDNEVPDEDRGKSSSLTCCQICGRNFDDEQLLSQHVETIHQKTVCTICGMAFDSILQFKTHKIRCHLEPKYSCSKCDQTFQYKHTFLMHLATHEKKAKFQCEICDQRFEDQPKLQSHMVSEHKLVMKPDGFQCTCPFCGDTIADIAKFRYHKLKFHTKPKFQCPHCPRQFSTKSSYQIHSQSHKKTKIYTCRFCSVKFKLIHNLRAHIQRKHGDKLKESRQPVHVLLINQDKSVDHNQSTTPQNIDSKNLNHESSMISVDEGSLACEKIDIKHEILVEPTSTVPATANSTECLQCHQLFSDQNELQDHLRVSHLPIECLICGLDFVNVARLSYHRLTSHTKPRFKCSHCSKTFHVKSGLIRHEMGHIKISETKPSEPVFRGKRRRKPTSLD